jgi:predicted nucleic acid-binding protein
VRSWTDPAAGNQIGIAEIAITETLATLARFRWERQLSTASFDRLREDFLLHVDEEYLVDTTDSPLLVAANGLVLRHPLRTLDALHLASALEIARVFSTMPLFVSGDRQLLAAATAEGFTTDDPNSH